MKSSADVRQSRAERPSGVLEEFLELIRSESNLVEDTDVTSRLSGTFQSSVSLKIELEEVRVYDSGVDDSTRS